MDKVISILFLLTACFGLAQSGHRIEVSVKNYPHKRCFLANYFGDQQYINDTADISPNGTFIFEGKDPLVGGIYTVADIQLTPLVELIVDEQHFTVETDTLDYLGKMKVVGSKNNELFKTYRVFLVSQQQKAKKIQSSMKSAANAVDSAKLKDRLAEIETEFQVFKKKLMAENPSTFFTKIMLAQDEPELADIPLLENGKKDSIAEYLWRKNHYFDQIDLTDLRLLYTPILPQKLRYYFDYRIVPNPDSLINAIDFVLGKALNNEEVFKFVCITIYNKYRDSKIMGYDAVFVHLTKNYYTKERAFWVDEMALKEIKEREQVLEPLLIGKKAPNLVLQDTANNWHNLHDFKSKYTVLYFWDSTCDHCQKVTPMLRDLHQSLKTKGVDIFAVNTEFETKKWKKYVRDNQLLWLNVSDNPHSTFPQDLRKSYDIFGTPVVYILDENKTILAKKLEVEQIEDYFEQVIFKKEN